MPLKENYKTGGKTTLQARAHRYYGAHFKKCMPSTEMTMITFDRRVIQTKAMKYLHKHQTDQGSILHCWDTCKLPEREILK
jgi:hypothetical protein